MRWRRPQRADTLIYSILYSDPGAYGVFGGRDGKRVLQRMSNDTGGSFFEVSKEQTVDRMFDILQEELRNQYNLGYVSDKPITISEFRTIQLTVRQKGLRGASPPSVLGGALGDGRLLAPKQHLPVEIGNVQISRAALQFIQPLEQIASRGGKILDVGAGQNP